MLLRNKPHFLTFSLKYLNSAISMILVLPIRFYKKLLSPLKLRPSCKFYPSCSTYMMQAIIQHGAVKGLFLGVCRLFRCHPWSLGGVDNVPEVFRFSNLWMRLYRSMKK